MVNAKFWFEVSYTTHNICSQVIDFLNSIYLGWLRSFLKYIIYMIYFSFVWAAVDKLLLVIEYM